MKLLSFYLVQRVANAPHGDGSKLCFFYMVQYLQRKRIVQFLTHRQLHVYISTENVHYLTGESDGNRKDRRHESQSIEYWV